MQQAAATTLVQDLMTELAAQDARQASVNSTLYDRSATYQRTLDGLLGAEGQFVARTDGRAYQVLTRRVA